MSTTRPHEPVSTKLWRFSGLFAGLAILLGFATAITSSAQVGGCTGVAVLACIGLGIAGFLALAVERR